MKPSTLPRGTVSSLIVAVLVAFVSGLGAAPPAGGQEKAPILDPESNRAEAAGVTVSVETDAWPLDEPLDPGVQPFRLEIRNRSGRSLQLRYDQVTLVGASGDRYAVVPLYDVLLAGTESEYGKPLVKIEKPKFGQISFRIAPGYSEIFPNSETFPSHFGDDREYTRFYERQFDPALKPTVQMFERLLPEGVIDDGGLASGFLYFADVDPWEPGLTLELRLVDAEDGLSFGTATVPLEKPQEEEMTEADDASGR
jgi:hypothetical protein